MKQVNPTVAIAKMIDTYVLDDPEPPTGGSVSDGNTKGLGGTRSSAGVGGLAGGTCGGMFEVTGATVGVPSSTGEMVGLGVILIVGAAVGTGVPLPGHWLDSALTQRGTNRSNCCKVSNTEAKKHNEPELLVMLFDAAENVFPKTTTFDTPTVLSMKHVSSIVNGPSVSTRKLLVPA